MAVARKKNDSVVIEFSFEKETKTTRRYKEEADEPVIGSIYIKKSKCEEMGNPEAITVTVDPHPAS